MSSSTESGLPFKPVYDASDLADFDPSVELGEPGEFPFTRGVYPTMYTGRPWTMRQYAGFGNAAESNERYKQLIAAGTTGLSVAFDLPTQMGYDSDHKLAHGEVGKVGVAIDSVDDMQVLFDGIPLDKVSTSMTINATAAWMTYVSIVESLNLSDSRNGDVNTPWTASITEALGLADTVSSGSIGSSVRLFTNDIAVLTVPVPLFATTKTVDLIATTQSEAVFLS